MTGPGHESTSICHYVGLLIQHLYLEVSELNIITCPTLSFNLFGSPLFVRIIKFNLLSLGHWRSKHKTLKHEFASRSTVFSAAETNASPVASERIATKESRV